MILFMKFDVTMFHKLGGDDRSRARPSLDPPFISQLYIPSLFVSAQLTPCCQLPFDLILCLALKASRPTFSFKTLLIVLC